MSYLSAVHSQRAGRRAASCAGALLVGIALLHLYFAYQHWPFATRTDAVESLIGSGADAPPAVAFWLIAAVFLLLAWIVGWWAPRSPIEPARRRWLALAVIGGAFALRGALGLVGDLASGLDTPSARADALASSPLALLVGCLCLSAARAMRA